MDHVAIVLQGAVLAGILWLFRSVHLMAVRLARIEERLKLRSREPRREKFLSTTYRWFRQMRSREKDSDE